MKEKSELNRDVIISGLGIGLLYYFFPRVEILIIGSVYLLICFLIKSLKILNHKFWITVTKILQTITSPILFGAIFIFILLPIGLLFRVFKKKKKQENSTFEVVNQTIDQSFFDVPW